MIEEIFISKNNIRTILYKLIALIYYSFLVDKSIYDEEEKVKKKK